MKEWWEGPEELRAIPHSFSIVLRDRRDPMAVYMDMATDKVSARAPIFTLSEYPDALINTPVGVLHGTSVSLDLV